MDRRDAIEQALLTALAPERMSLVDESRHHSVKAGAQSHWNLIVVAHAFEGMNPVQRHRAVYRALDDQLRGGIHALTLKALTPKEWEDAGGEVENPAPPCLGGSKRRGSDG